jgi:hypothetical protein
VLVGTVSSSRLIDMCDAVELTMTMSGLALVTTRDGGTVVAGLSTARCPGRSAYREES